MKKLTFFFNKVKTSFFIGVAFLISPSSVLAGSNQPGGGTLTNVSSFADLVLVISNIINETVKIIISLTVLVFLWGVFKMVKSGDDTEARKEARSTIIFGIVALFVMVSVWGLVNILKASIFGGGLIIPQLK